MSAAPSAATGAAAGPGGVAGSPDAAVPRFSACSEHGTAASKQAGPAASEVQTCLPPDDGQQAVATGGGSRSSSVGRHLGP